MSWFFLSIGLIFWIVLLTMVVNRLVFHDPVPERLQPTLVILIAPPAVGFLGWTALTGGIDPLARILMNATLFFLLVVVVQMPRLIKLPFSMSFWALSFPLAAATTAALRYGAAMESGFHIGVGLGLLTALVLVLAALLAFTARAVMRGNAF